MNAPVRMMHQAGKVAFAAHVDRRLECVDDAVAAARFLIDLSVQIVSLKFATEGSELKGGRGQWGPRSAEGESK